jgi:Ca-activated chloride channel homolog
VVVRGDFMIFQDSWIFYIFGVFAVFFFFLRIKNRPFSFIFPSEKIISGVGGTFRGFLANKLVYLKFLGIVLMVLALARPRTGGDIDVAREAVAVMIAIDSSSSMLAEDFGPGITGLVQRRLSGDKTSRVNRITAAKRAARHFMEKRPNDLIGIVAFAAQAYIIVPPTFDREWLYKGLDRVDVGLIRDATAIGSGIMSALTALKDVDAKSSVIILLTDGINNFGDIPPLVAARAARAMGVKVYTIGILSRGHVPFPVTDQLGRKSYKNVLIDIDTDILKEISAITGGEYYTADNLGALHNSFKHIDELEKVEISESRYDSGKDIFPVFLWPGIFLVVIERLLASTVLRKVP